MPIQQSNINDGEGAANTIQSELAQWISRRGQIKSQLTKFQAFLCDDKSKNITQLRLRKEKIEKLWEEFDVMGYHKNIYNRNTYNRIVRNTISQVLHTYI
jgi:hypothetical protein